MEGNFFLTLLTFLLFYEMFCMELGTGGKWMEKLGLLGLTLHTPISKAFFFSFPFLLLSCFVCRF